MDFLGSKIADAKRIVESAIAKYNPKTILLGFTGGSDSLTLANVMEELKIPFTPFLLNTGIGIEDQRVFIREYCSKKGWALIEQKPVYKLYKQMVVQNGFPGPAMHTVMFRNLKEKSLRVINSSFNCDTIVLSGVRVAESEKRKINIKQEIQVVDKIKWVAPIMNWDSDDKEEFLEERNIELSHVSKELGMSGECLCGAYAMPGEKDKLRSCSFAKNEIKQIETLERITQALGFTWGWDDLIPKGKEYDRIMETIYPGYCELTSTKKEIAKAKKDGTVFNPMCHKCTFNHELNLSKI